MIKNDSIFQNEEKITYVGLKTTKESYTLSPENRLDN